MRAGSSKECDWQSHRPLFIGIFSGISSIVDVESDLFSPAQLFSMFLEDQNTSIVQPFLQLYLFFTGCAFACTVMLLCGSKRPIGVGGSFRPPRQNGKNVFVIYCAAQRILVLN